jgi:transcriptional regulator with XRE-family HTH domain
VIEDEPRNACSRRTRISRLAKALTAPGRRHAYMATQLKAFLSDQIRTLRGDLTQSEFGDKIGKPQSVISRLEKQLDRHISIQTLIDIAVKLDIAVIIRFVDFVTFLRYTEDYSDNALAPRSYDQAAIDAFAEGEEQRAQGSEIQALVAGNLRPSDQQTIEASIPQIGVLPTAPDHSADVVDESPALTAAIQSAPVQSAPKQSAEVIDLAVILTRQLQESRSAASGTLGSNAIAQPNGIVESAAA